MFKLPPILFSLAVLPHFAIGTFVVAQDRVLGIDVSAWQSNISQTTWNNIHDVDGRDFVFVRSSRGGTTGFYNQSDPNNNSGRNTLSQRYDDHYFVQNITRATNAGMYAGPYHFSRPDIIASTQNSGGIANSGADEADHFLEMAGAWMRPGYLLPVHDLEAGDGSRTGNAMAQFALDFSNRIHEVMGIRPAIYLNGNYAEFVLGGASTSIRNQVVETHPVLWSARWPNQDDPSAIPVQTGHPRDSFSRIYGPWDNAPNPTHPWAFWQYASTGRLSSFNNGNSNLDLNVAQGGIEFLKDQLVPALWVPDTGGSWSTLANWNSGQPPIAPVQGAGQASRVGPLSLPEIRLPGPDDTVVLEKSAIDILVTLNDGAHEVRKLVVRESLDISGGSLRTNYIPSPDSTLYSAEIYADVSITEEGSFSAHSIYIDSETTLTLGGSITFDSIGLSSDSVPPANIDLVGDVTFIPFADETASIGHASGSGFGAIRLEEDVYHRVDIPNLIDGTDVFLDIPIIGSGGIVKSGEGTLRLAASTGYTGNIVVDQGELILADPLVRDAAEVYLSSEARIELDFEGVDVVKSAFRDGVGLSPGTWGAPGSGADFTDPMFGGTGMLRVLIEDEILPGDFNQDGGVDSADFTVWRAAFHQTGLSPYSGADGNGDGIVDRGDYEVWQTNYGTFKRDFVAQVVPEPYSWFGALSFFWFLVLRRPVGKRLTPPS